MRLLKAMIISLLLVACESPHDLAKQFRYVKDDRTDLCFATWALGGNGGTMTQVPCSYEVVKLIEEDKTREKRK